MIQPGETETYEPLALPFLPRPLLVLLVLGGICAASLAVGMFAANGEIMLLLALIGLPVALIAAIGAIRYFAFLVVVLPVTALAMRFAMLPTGTASPLPISLAITLGLVGIWVVVMFTRRDWQVPATSFNRSLFIFIAVCCFSLPWGILWRDPILNMRIMGRGFPITQVASLMSLLASMCVPWLIGRFIDREWKVRFYLGAFLVCGTLMTMTQLFSIDQIFLNDGGLWGLWYAAPLFGIMLVLPGLDPRWRLLCGILLGAHLYLAVVQNSLWLSGWMPTLIGLTAIVFFHSRKAFSVLAIVGVIFIALGPGREFLEVVASDNANEGGLERLDIWARNLGIVAQHWLLGTGPAGYAPYNMTYFPYDARSTHNNFFDILAQFGVVGFLAWIWFMFASLWYGWKTIQHLPPGFLRTVAIIATGGWAGALASMMFGDWILPFAYNQGIGGYGYTVYSWIFLGLLVSVRRIGDATAE